MSEVRLEFWPDYEGQKDVEKVKVTFIGATVFDVLAMKVDYLVNTVGAGFEGETLDASAKAATLPPTTTKPGFLERAKNV